MKTDDQPFKQTTFAEYIVSMHRNPTELARTEDPEESKLGANDAAQRLAQMRLYALRCVEKHPGMTCSELAMAEDIRDPRMIGRRLGELEMLGLVTRGAGRPCNVTGRTAATWRAKER